MMRDKFDFSQLEPDIVTVMMQKIIAMAPGFSAAIAAQVEAEVRQEFGGQRHFVPKGRKRLTPEERERVYQDGLSNIDDQAIVEKHKISQRTLYRIMKEGGGRFS